MAENTVKLSGSSSAATIVWASKCIICQSSSGVTTNSENGRKRIREAAEIRNDCVSKRLKLITSDNLYQINNKCYKTYTLRKTLDTIQAKKSESPEKDYEGGRAETASVHHFRSQSTPRAVHSGQSSMSQSRKMCVICGKIKCLGIFAKYQISEKDRASRFLEATVFLQDDVYKRIMFNSSF